MKKIYIGFAFMHHKGTNAGYHHLVEYLHYDKIMDCQKEIEWPDTRTTFCGKLLVRVLWHLKYPFHMWVAVRAILYNLFHCGCVFHFIYGENTYRWMKPFLRKDNRIVCTLHQPFAWFDNPLWRKRLRQMDGIILMADDEIDKFREAAPNAKICFIPHGINVDFYNEGKTYRKKQILMVGNWLRKFEFANSVFKKILEDDPTMNVVVVANKRNHQFFDSNSRLQLLSGITDEQLRDLYHESQCLFLPLEAYTANNAVLEAAATNCPIIIATDSPSDSYLSDGKTTIVPLDFEKAVACLKKSERGHADTRNFVVDNFSWQVVAHKTEQFMSELL